LYWQAANAMKPALMIITGRNLLDLIITGQLSSIDDCVTRDVWAKACPQSGDAFLPSDLGISIHGPSIAALHARRKLPLSLKPDLDKVSGVGDGDGNGTCSQSVGSSLGVSGE
jgi:hypothetical protein